MEQKIHFVTGKGGVGKTVVALALALSFAKKGKKTLYVDLGDGEGGFEPLTINNSLFKATWSGESCLRDYLKHIIKSDALLKLFWETPITKSLIHAAPGLAELSILGKVTSGIRHHGPKLNFDALVVDAYATGHFKSLLTSSSGLGEVMSSGPLFEQSRSIKQVLLDPKQVAFHVISLCENYAIQEAIELKNFLGQYGVTQIQIWLNKYLELSQKDLFPREQDFDKAPLFSAYLKDLYFKQEQSLRAFRGEAKSENLNVKTLPWILKNEDWSVVESISQKLS